MASFIKANVKKLLNAIEAQEIASGAFNTVYSVSRDKLKKQMSELKKFLKTKENNRDLNFDVPGDITQWVARVRKEKRLAAFTREMDVIHKIHGKGISPTYLVTAEGYPVVIRDQQEAQSIGVTFMEKFDCSLSDYFTKVAGKVDETWWHKTCSLISELIDNDVYCYDLTPKNFVVKYNKTDGEISDLKAIDFDGHCEAHTAQEYTASQKEELKTLMMIILAFKTKNYFASQEKNYSNMWKVFHSIKKNRLWSINTNREQNNLYESLNPKHSLHIIWNAYVEKLGELKNKWLVHRMKRSVNKAIIDVVKNSYSEKIRNAQNMWFFSQRTGRIQDGLGLFGMAIPKDQNLILTNHHKKKKLTINSENYNVLYDYVNYTYKYKNPGGQKLKIASSQFEELVVNISYDEGEKKRAATNTMRQKQVSKPQGTYEIKGTKLLHHRFGPIKFHFYEKLFEDLDANSSVALLFKKLQEENFDDHLKTFKQMLKHLNIEKKKYVYNNSYPLLGKFADDLLKDISFTQKLMKKFQIQDVNLNEDALKKPRVSNSNRDKRRQWLKQAFKMKFKNKIFGKELNEIQDDQEITIQGPLLSKDDDIAVLREVMQELKSNGPKKSKQVRTRNPSNQPQPPLRANECQQLFG